MICQPKLRMTVWPDAALVRAFLSRVQRRLVLIAGLQGAAIGLAIAVVISVAIGLAKLDPGLLVDVSVAVAAVAIGAAVAMMRPRRVPALVEARAPQCRNLIITADELIEQPTRVRPDIGQRVCHEAAHIASALDPSVLFPASRAVTGLALTVAVWSLTIAMIAAQPGRTFGSPSATSPIAAITGVDLTVTPPAYSGRPAQRFSDPARVEALAGSRIALTVRANASTVTLETLAGRQVIAINDSKAFQGEVIADADGYIAIEPAALNGRAGARRLIGLSVLSDRPPQVRTMAPGRDLLFPDGNRTIDVAIEATDDIGLATLRLRYTKVSGSDEQFTFTEGEVPVQLTRVDGRTWRARGTLPLNTLALTPGDMVVYRGAATDKRPGASAAESDAYIIEITAPGAVAAEGFAIDDERDKYALSQQMMVIKTERLIARAPSMPGDSLLREAMTLAAEQRSVRAEFVFMMGGELAEEVLAAAGVSDLNEESLVAADDEAIAGRLANQGRLALVLAIRSMSRANTALNAADLTRALAEEKAALEQLQRAFSRTRYILRALTQRERLDLSRRLTGELAGVSRTTRPSTEPEVEPRHLAMRDVLASIAAIPTTDLTAADAVRVSALAQRILRVDPSAEALQQIAALLDNSATAIADGRNSQARTQLDRAATQLAAVLRAELTDSPNVTGTPGARRLEGALVDALRRKGSR